MRNRHFQLNDFEFRRRALIGKLLSHYQELENKLNANPRSIDDLQEFKIFIPILSLIEFRYEKVSIPDNGIFSNNFLQVAIFHLVAEFEWEALMKLKGKSDYTDLPFSILLKEERKLIEEYYPGILNNPQLNELALAIVKLDSVYNDAVDYTKVKMSDLKNNSLIKRLKDAILYKKIFIGINNTAEAQALFSEDNIRLLCDILYRLNITVGIILSDLKDEIVLNNLFRLINHSKFKSINLRIIHPISLSNPINMQQLWKIISKSRLREFALECDIKSLTPESIQNICDSISISCLKLLDLSNCAFFKDIDDNLLPGYINNLSIVVFNGCSAKTVLSNIFERKIIPTNPKEIILARNGLLYEMESIGRVLGNISKDESILPRIKQIQFKIEKCRTLFKDQFQQYKLDELDKAEFILLRDLVLFLLQDDKPITTSVMDPLFDVPVTSTYYAYARIEAFIIAYNGFYQKTDSKLVAFINALNYCIDENELIDFKDEQATFDGFLCGAVNIKKLLGTNLDEEMRLKLLQFVCLKYATQLFENINVSDFSNTLFRERLAGIKAQLNSLGDISDLSQLQDNKLNKKITNLWEKIDQIKRGLPSNESDFIEVLNMLNERLDNRHGLR